MMRNNGLKTEIRQPDPLMAFKYSLSVSGLTEGVFQEIGGLSLKREVFTYKEGGVNDREHNFPVRVKQSNITLKRGLAYSDELWQWFIQGLHDNKVDKRDVTIYLYAHGNAQPAVTWHLQQAYPVSWQGPQLGADSNSITFESLELVHEGLTMSMGRSG
jgi:phage tail-like protein